MIHQYKNNGYNIIIDANSGCIHSVDDVAYDIIKLVDEGIGDAQSIFNEIKDKYNDITIDDVTETLEDIELLKKEGKLFSDDIFRDLAPYMKDKQSVLKAICLHVAHDCNMNCGYCFAGKGEYNGPKGLMTFETAKKAIDFLVEHSPGRRNLEVDFFGGELQRGIGEFSVGQSVAEGEKHLFLRGIVVAVTNVNAFAVFDGFSFAGEILIGGIVRQRQRIGFCQLARGIDLSGQKGSNGAAGSLTAQIGVQQSFDMRQPWHFHRRAAH